MTATSLADEFLASKGSTITRNGLDIFPTITIAVRNGSGLRLRRLGASSRRAQAMKLAVDRGALNVNGVSAPTVALWTHTAPATADLIVEGAASQVTFWNAWSIDGIDTSWVGNAGMTATEDDQGLTIRCSDGVGEVSFDDLVLWLGVDW